MKTKPWGNPEKSVILVIGHDPGLQKSSTIAEFSLFSDYYFRPKPSSRSELAKYQFAEALFGYVKDLTTGHISDDKVLITNLCNETLPSSPKGKINYIPPEEADAGLETIRDLLKESSVRLIFPMSQQVNYWLQKLGFYTTDTGFLKKSEPKAIGTDYDPKYYSPKQSSAFKEICGNKYIADERYFLFPILHVKNYPLKGNFLIYEENYSKCKSEVAAIIDSQKKTFLR